MAKASRDKSHIEKQMSENAIFETWTKTWGLKIYPAYGIDRLRFEFIEKGSAGKGNTFRIFIECFRDGAQCFDNWAYDILHGRFERTLANEKMNKAKYPNAYKYITGENGEKSLGIMNSTTGEYCINAPVIGKDGKPVFILDEKGNKKQIFASVPVSFHDLRHIAEWYLISYQDRKRELEQIRKKAAEEWHDSDEPSSSDSAQTSSEPKEAPATKPQNDAPKQKTQKRPTPATKKIQLKTQSTLSNDGKGNFLLSAIDIENNTAEFVFPKEYWKSEKYGKVGEEFKEKATKEKDIMVTLHFYVYKNKKYVAKIDI